MARTPKIEETKAPGTEVMAWEAEMAAQAKIAAGVVANVGGNTPRFSIRGGMLTIEDRQIPGNQMGVVILDAVLENSFYEGEFDSENPAPPTCFAIGRDDASMAPHPTVVERGQAQHATCRGCPMNVFGTAERGKGKACKNRVRTVMIEAGVVNPDGKFTAYTDLEHFSAATAASLTVPPTSIGGFATYVKQIANTLRMPPHGMFTRVRVVPDPKTQVKVLFEPIAKVPVGLMQTLMKRNKEVGPVIEQPFNLDQEEKPEKVAPRGKSAVKRSVKGAKY